MPRTRREFRHAVSADVMPGSGKTRDWQNCNDVLFFTPRDFSAFLGKDRSLKPARQAAAKVIPRLSPPGRGKTAFA